jgi:hypothetical protein
MAAAMEARSERALGVETVVGTGRVLLLAETVVGTGRVLLMAELAVLIQA